MSAAPAQARAWMWNGAAFEPATGIPVTDRGFRYGMSVFESFPVRNGVALFLKQHLLRLRQACQRTGFQPPLDALEQCETILKQAGNGFGRIYLTAGDGPATSACETSRVVVFVDQRDPVPGGQYHRGYTLGIHPDAHTPLFGGLKTGNYWPNLDALKNGLANLYDETLLFTPAGHLISACVANVFVVTKGKLTTPAPTTGARNGVLREWIIQHAAVEETLLTRVEVETADEIFLTSSWLGIMPAAFIEDRPLKLWPITTPLLNTYQKEISE